MLKKLIYISIIGGLSSSIISQHMMFPTFSVSWFGVVALMSVITSIGVIPWLK